MKSKNEIDFCHGPLFKRMLAFVLPLILSSILQLSFNAADMAVIGRFASVESLGAVGGTAALCNFLLTIAMGLAVGVNVVVAHAVGAGDEQRISDSVHTSILVAIAGGFLFMFVSLVAARPLLELMRIPENVFERSCLYMRIFSYCIPPMVFSNFGSAILRAVGDTKRPLYYLSIAGVINVALNLLFVIRYDMDVAGVAWATAISQCFSAALVAIALYREQGAIRLIPSKLRINTKHFANLARIGLPAGIQSACFSASNMIIQSAVNSLGTLALAGNTAAHSLEGFIYVIGHAFSQAIVSIVGQNFGGNHPRRLMRSVRLCCASASVAMAISGAFLLLFGRTCLHAFTTDPDAIEWGFDRMSIILPTYFICAVMDIFSGALRGIGLSLAPTAISLFFVILLRILWVFFVFPIWPTMICLIISYPLSWIMATIANNLVFKTKIREIFGPDLMPLPSKARPSRGSL